MYCVYSLCNMMEAEEEEEKPIKVMERMIKWHDIINGREMHTKTTNLVKFLNFGYVV